MPIAWLILAQDSAQPATAVGGGGSLLLASVTIFMLAVFVGFEIITKIPPTLHTPLMSGSNAISGITVVGALIAAGSGGMAFAKFLGFLAVVLAMINVVGGFLVTHRMLGKFKRR
jgi:NAD(P) transhydrogenase subunit alpha